MAGSSNMSVHVSIRFLAAALGHRLLAAVPKRQLVSAMVAMIAARVKLGPSQPVGATAQMQRHSGLECGTRRGGGGGHKLPPREGVMAGLPAEEGRAKDGGAARNGPYKVRARDSTPGKNEELC